jgi:hypothetical protein
MTQEAMKPWQRFLIISSSSTLALALFPAPSKSQAIESFCAAARDAGGGGTASEAEDLRFQ